MLRSGKLQKWLSALLVMMLLVTPLTFTTGCDAIEELADILDDLDLDDFDFDDFDDDFDDDDFDFDDFDDDDFDFDDLFDD